MKDRPLNLIHLALEQFLCGLDFDPRLANGAQSKDRLNGSFRVVEFASEYCVLARQPGQNNTVGHSLTVPLDP
ncbi:hypothetical protein [Phenylobacterium koreense]|uniref:Uncharacterized protein n=1 Tax=Phenylobacterium koreense TaxID=266125 RepID=A0ABV2EHF8_9CAUL